MTFMAVCGFGVGSSLMLKINIEKVCKELGVEATVVNSDVSSIKGAVCDAIFTSSSLYEKIKNSVDIPVYSITNFVLLGEIRSALEMFLTENN